MNKQKENSASAVQLLARTGLIVGLVVVGYEIVQANFKPIWEDPFAVFRFLKYLFFFVLFIVTLVVDSVFYSRHGNKLNFLPTLTGSVFFAIIAVRLFSIYSDEQKEVVFHVRTVVGEEPFLEVEFKKEGVFKFIENSRLGPTYVFGNYEMKDSVITFHDFEFLGFDFPDSWSFKGDTLFAGDTKFVFVE